MKKTNKLIEKHIAGRPIREYAIGFLIVLTAVLIFANILGGVGRFITELLPTTHYFDIQSVRFIGRKNDSLVFVSNTKFNVSEPVIYTDILRCKDGDSFTFFSTQKNAIGRPRPTQDYRVIKWNYNQPFPVGQECHMETIAVMTINGIAKEQAIKSETFKIR